MKMTKYEKANLTKTALVMDESYFVDCVVTDSDLFYSGGDVEWVNTRFDNCRWHFRGQALKTVQTLTLIGLLKPQPMSVSLQANTAKAN